MRGEVLIAGITGIIIGAVAAALIMAGPGLSQPDGYGQYTWSGPRAGWGQGMMGPGMMGQGMMSGSRGPSRADSVPVSLSEAERRASDFARQLGEGYVAEDIMGFTENYYAVIEEERSGAGITEILVDRYTGQVTLEPGPAMMWRIRGGTPASPATYDPEEARSLGETFLRGYLPGAKILESHAFPGYYTLDFGRDGAEGMLSVNAYSGAIWVHTWHGLPLADS
ncbi:MAG: hypothetical protein LUO96_02685 [Methanomicrobiales archaeon]|nr:hypothetical protein [Methanomicrobiales archaeon]